MLLVQGLVLAGLATAGLSEDQSRLWPPGGAHVLMVRSTPATIGVAALRAALRQAADGEVRLGTGIRAADSTDASNFRQLPIEVMLPRTRRPYSTRRQWRAPTTLRCSPEAVGAVTVALSGALAKRGAGLAGGSYLAK